ncbi:MAG: bifunctional riboflavin kinase/FAD synthetase [Nitrospirota bacterium]
MNDIVEIAEPFLIPAYPVVAIGNFDGVHLGHQAILKTTIARAKEKNGTAVALTFWPHPSKVLFPDRETSFLTSSEEKKEMILSLGVDTVLFVEFNKDFAMQTPEQFVRNLLVEKIGCKEVIVGKEFLFGKGRLGNVVGLSDLGQQLNFMVSPQEPVFLEDTLVSSSAIRNLLLDGNVSLAAKMLSRPYVLEGEVVYGDGAGVGLGVATANMNLPDRIIPKEGIYAARVTLSDAGHAAPYDSVVYVGSKPTFHENGEIKIEAHLFDYDKKLYGEKIKVAFIEWIRPDKKFHSAAALMQQMKVDILMARTILGGTAACEE